MQRNTRIQNYQIRRKFYVNITYLLHYFRRVYWLLVQLVCHSMTHIEEVGVSIVSDNNLVSWPWALENVLLCTNSLIDRYIDSHKICLTGDSGKLSTLYHCTVFTHKIMSHVAVVRNSFLATNGSAGLVNPWELPAGWSKSMFYHFIEPARMGVRKTNLMCKFVG